MVTRKAKPRVLGPLMVVGILAAVGAVGWLAPTELSMGSTQRIVYVHVPLAWLGLLGFLAMEASGLVYLARRDLGWDHWSQAAGEWGWAACSLTLASGSLWARAAWGSWWEWDPRLTTAFILWVVYTAILLVRWCGFDPHRRASVAAVLALVGGLDVPWVVMATRWYRGLHPVAPELAPPMRIALAVNVVILTVFFVWLVCRRRAQLGLVRPAADAQSVERAGESPAVAGSSANGSAAVAA